MQFKDVVGIFSWFKAKKDETIETIFMKPEVLKDVTRFVEKKVKRRMRAYKEEVVEPVEEQKNGKKRSRKA